NVDKTPQMLSVCVDILDNIDLKVAGQNGSDIQFKIKRHTAFSKLMKDAIDVFQQQTGGVHS
uniref:Uncharacterized protein n=1 Tax=Acanthochromis polyacanthus TaxID=80966 RepID=A0A3Q1GSB2_9TELE